jgi:spermidine/putrescine transport system ATP-binding protein
MSQAAQQTAGSTAPDEGRTSGEPDIRLERVSKRFGDTLAVDDLTLAIPRGSFFALLGPSGCGKTTTLRVIGGFEDPDSGSAFLGGRDVTQLPPYKRDVNTVFQSYALFPHLNVERNVAFGLERRKLDREEIRQRVHDVLELTQLQGFEKRRPEQLSGGQQQRVALARALVNRPRALLLDEPLGALDLRLRKQLQIELKRIQQEVGITFVHVTHDQEEAMTMADEIAVMNRGKIEQRGGAEELYERPATEFVAGFLGDCNLMDATAGEREGELTALDTAAGRLWAPAERVDARSGELRAGVRPEKVRLGPAQDPPDLPNRIRGSVDVASFLGTAIQYLVQTDAGEMKVITQNSGDGQPESLGPGREVVLAWDPRHTVVVTKEES